MQSNPLHFMAWCRAGAVLACVLCTVSMARAVGGTAGIDAMTAWQKRLDVLVNQATGKPYRAIIDQMRSEGMGDGVHDERPLVVHKIGGGSTVTLPGNIGISAAFGVDDAGVVRSVVRDVKAPIVTGGIVAVVFV